MSDSFGRYPSLKDAVFLVSGGASGIGSDIVTAAYQQGAKVAFLDVDLVVGEALATSYPVISQTWNH
jgi:D-xylose 1-dehydrogenase